MVRYSTGTVQLKAKDKTEKEIFNDGVLRIYGGFQPIDADNAINGAMLCEITLLGLTFVPGTKSTRQKSTVTVTAGTAADKYIVNINGVAYEYDMIQGDSATIIAAALAELIDVDDAVSAVSSVGVVVIRAKFGGNVFTITNVNSTQVGNVVIATPTASVRAAGIQFGSATAGILEKETGTWSGTAVATGTAAWWRISGNAVDAGTGGNTTLPRIDGNCSTTSGDLILRTLEIVTGDPIVIQSCTITIPKVRT